MENRVERKLSERPGSSRREQVMKTREEFQEIQGQQGLQRDNLGSGLKTAIKSVKKRVTGEISENSYNSEVGEGM